MMTAPGLPSPCGTEFSNVAFAPMRPRPAPASGSPSSAISSISMVDRWRWRPRHAEVCACSSCCRVKPQAEHDGPAAVSRTRQGGLHVQREEEPPSDITRLADDGVDRTRCGLLLSVVRLRGQDLRREEERDHPSHEGSYQGTSVAMACLTKASTCLCDFNSGEVSARSCS